MLYIKQHTKKKFWKIHNDTNCLCDEITLNTTLIKKFQEFIQKIKNTNLFIKIDIGSFKVLLIDCNILMLELDPILETFFTFGFRNGHQSRLRSFHYLLLEAKTRSPKRFFVSNIFSKFGSLSKISGLKKSKLCLRLVESLASMLHSKFFVLIKYIYTYYF